MAAFRRGQKCPKKFSAGAYLRVIANFLILLNMICNIYQETLLLSQKALITLTFDIWGQFERGNIR